MSKKGTRIPIPGTKLLYGFKDSKQLVYHYTKAETFTKKILPSNSLRLSPYTETNDPKESKAWRFGAMVLDPQLHSLSDWAQKDLDATMNRELKERTNVVCFSCDGPLTGDHIRDIQFRGWCKPRMWAQYGDDHKGVCLVFDRERLESAFAKAFNGKRPMAIGRVEYRDRTIVSRLDDPTYAVVIDELTRLGWEDFVRFHLRHSYKRLFFEKSVDWSTEAEYRCVVWGGDGKAVNVDFGDSLRGVMFGASATDETIDTIYDAVHGLDIFTQQLEWQGCAPWYNLGGSVSWEIRHRERSRAV